VGRGLNTFEIELLDSIDVAENGVQVVPEARHLLIGERETREQRDVPHLLF